MHTGKQWSKKKKPTKPKQDVVARSTKHLISSEFARPGAYREQEKCSIYTEMWATSFCKGDELHERPINTAANTAASKKHFRSEEQANY